MSFAIGDTVRIIPLKKDGIVEEVLSGEKYRVRSGMMSVTCRESDLVAKAPVPVKKSQDSPRTRKIKSAISVSKEVKALQKKRRRFEKAPCLDLHGRRVHEVTPLVEGFLNDTSLAGYDSVEIVHGLGTGALQHAVHTLLRSIPVVAHFKIKEGNGGTTLVYFQ
jgi:DNA mismatch repair protein MutS2